MANRWLLKGMLFLALTLHLIPPASAQPACVTCCCGDAEEVGFPCGHFEEPPLAAPGGWIDYAAGQTYCGWTVVSGTISIHHGGHNNLGAGNPNGASQHLDLNGSSPGVVERPLTGLVPGSQYTITLWYAAHNAAGTATARMLINDGAWLDETWSTDVPGNVNWEQRCLTFLAQASSTTIRLIGSSNNPCCGMLIDDISMWACTPDQGPPIAENPPPPLLQLSCDQPLPPPADLMISDDCDDNPAWTLTSTTDPQPCGFDLTHTWILTDACGQTDSLQQRIEVRDAVAPYFTQPPADLILPCGQDIEAAFLLWTQDRGGAQAEDNCDTQLDWSVTYDAPPPPNCGETLVTFTVTDACGNSAQTNALFLVEDISPPVLIRPASDATLHCVPAPGDSLAAWLQNQGGALAADPCEPLLWSHDFMGDSLAPAITVTFTATDACGLTISTTATFFQSQGNDTLLLQSFTCNPLLAGTDTLITGLPGCESITINQRILLPSDTLQVQISVCNPALTGQDTLFLQNIGGCDSVIITSRVLAPSDTTWLFVTTCDPAAAGTDTLYGINQWGCDSLLITQTTFSPQYIADTTILICGPGTPYTDTLIVQTGPCDSLFLTRYSYSLPDTTRLFEQTCNPALAGVFILPLQNLLGCDSTVIRQVELLPTDTLYIQEVTCDPELEEVSTQTLTNAWGCDSVVIRTITYAGIDTTFIQSITCDSATAGIFLNVYTRPGLPCDSVVVTTLSWVPTLINTLPPVIRCEPDGPVADTLWLPSQGGCDSLLIQPYLYTSLQAQLLLTPEDCAGNNNGKIEVALALGGIPPYQYRIHNQPWQNQPIFDGLPPGTYTITLQDNQGCEATFSGLLITQGESLSLQTNQDITSAPGLSLNLSAQASSPPAQWLWSALDPLTCPTCPATSLGPLTAGQWVTVQAWTANGCPASAQFYITLASPTLPQVYIPNSFSPNNDGINDRFTIYSNDQVIAVHSMAIYDRWGNALFYQTDLSPNQPGNGWDGTFRDQPMDPGVYVYVVELLLEDGRTVLYKGDLTLMR